MKTLKIVLLFALFALGCSKDDPPSPPGVAALTLPAKNSECSPIEEGSSANTNLVRFSWQASANTETYLLLVEDLSRGTTQMKTTTALFETLPLATGTPFSWSVTSKNTAVTETAISETWFFFSPGTETTYLPFPAGIIKPNGPKAFIDEIGEVTIEWEGFDLDNDIEGYELYFSTENPPSLFSSFGADQTMTTVAATANTIYYFKIITKDLEGNSSDTGVISFEAI